MYRFMLLALSTALLSTVSSARAQVPPTMPRAGDQFEITRSYETSRQSEDGLSSGSSSGRTTILERVVAVRDGGLELIYDLPKGSSKDDRAREWQFPARVFRPANGPVQLLNAPALEERLETWLKTAKWTRAMCGRMIFTWNAFRIECDPQSVLETVAAYDLRLPAISEGAAYRDSEARGLSPLVRKSGGAAGTNLSVTMEIDPDSVRRSRAQTDVAVGEILQMPTTFEAALRERVKERISGTIVVTFDLDPSRNVYRRTKLTTLRSTGTDGRSETETRHEVTERMRTKGR